MSRSSVAPNRRTRGPLREQLMGRLNGLVARGQIYETLSLLYGVPGQALLERGFLALLTQALGHCNPNLDGELQELESYLGRLQDITPLEQEYVRLFRGPGKAAVYPYESMHVDGEIMGPSTLAVLDCYRKGRISPTGDFKDLPDHVCAELEFMYYLCAMELQCWFRRDLVGRATFQRLQFSFLDEHLARWIPSFAEAIRRYTSSPFYQALAVITIGFLRGEMARLGKGALSL